MRFDGRKDSWNVVAATQEQYNEYFTNKTTSTFKYIPRNHIGGEIENMSLLTTRLSDTGGRVGVLQNMP